ncbi:MAG: c-type cytochrome [Deltaproteobacteria bacterium]|nr:c-type cytochrome [Deltaproteobacteria bacterium]
MALERDGLKSSAGRRLCLNTLPALFLFMFTILALADEVTAAPSPAGELMDAIPVENDETRVCSVYLHKKKVQTVLSRIDGKRILKKKFWTKQTVKSQLKLVNQSIKTLKRSRSVANIKSLKKVAKEKKELTAAKRQLLACSKDDGSVRVRFSHVKGIIENRCMNCHGVLGWENKEEFFISTGRVIPGEPGASTFYTFLSNNPEGFLPAYMPKGEAPLSDLNLVLLSRYIRDLKHGQLGPRPTPTGEEGEGRDLYQKYCASCHGPVDVSAKWGRTIEQIIAAMAENPQMHHLKGILSPEDIRKIALALSRVSPPLEGTVSVQNVGPVVEGAPGTTSMMEFQVVFTGTASQPFTVGYVTSNGSAFAGSDFEFSSGTLAFQGVNGEKQIIRVPVYGDSFEESDEMLFVDIGGVSYGGVRVNTSTASGNIINDDLLLLNPPPVPGQLRMGYGFNGSYQDVLGIAEAVPQGDAALSPHAHTGTGSVELDEGPDYLLLPGNNLQGMSSFTLAAWVNWQNPTSTAARVFDFGSSTTNYIYFSPRDGTNRCRFEQRIGGAVFTLQCPVNQVLPSSQWAHVAVTFNSAGDQMKIFINGQEAASRTGVTLDLASMIFSDNRLGEGRTAGTGYRGLIDEVLVWDAALSQAEIQAAAAMTATPLINSGIEVRLNGQVIANGATLNLGHLVTGEQLTHSLFIQNRGPAGLALAGQPNVQIFGRDSESFSIKIQPMPWQQMLGINNLSSFALRYAPTYPGEKWATLTVTNSDLKDGNYALDLNATASGDPILGQSSDDPESPLSQGRNLYALNCSSCHGALATSTKTGLTIERLTAALNPTSGTPEMRGITLSAEEMNLIILALNSPAPKAEIETADHVINISTANHVVETLKDIFLPPGDVSSYTGNNLTIWSFITEGVYGVRTNGSFIAGRVAYFNRRAQRFDSSFQGEQALNLLRPIPDTIRTGLLNRTCDLITDNDGAVANALGKVGLTTSSPVTPQAVKNIYETLFAPGRVLPQYLADVTSTFPNGAPGLSDTDKWRFVLNLFCTSGVTEGI